VRQAFPDGIYWLTIGQKAEPDLHGLHLRLVESWDALPKLDSYAWRWVAYHMVKVDRKDDLRRLLLDFDYLQAKLSSTDPNALIADEYLPEDKDLQLVQSVIQLQLVIQDLAVWSKGLKKPTRCGPRAVQHAAEVMKIQVQLGSDVLDYLAELFPDWIDELAEVTWSEVGGW
jgi:hypothetical protein